MLALARYDLWKKYRRLHKYGISSIQVAVMQKNSISKGLPEDHSNQNTIANNFFGKGITAENIDLKEFTSSGIIAKNIFTGASIAGINGAIAWVAIKGNNYTIANNTGSGSISGGQGFRILQIHGGLGG